ncbi:MAG: hypothetical protein ACMUIU_10110 [bacterium]
MNAETIIAKLDDFNIKQVAIIDDAFDPPTLDDFLIEDIENFFNDISPDKDAKKQLKAICGKDINSPEDINNEDLSLIVKKLDTAANLKVHFENHLSVKIKEKKLHLDDIKQNLCSTLKLSVECYGSKVKPKELKEQVVFLDYFFGPGQDTDRAKEKAAEIVKIIKDTRGEDLPIIVLMSSKETNDVEIEEFRKKTELLPGIFYFFPKQDISKIENLILKLLPLSAGWSGSKKIQCFIDSIHKSIEDAKNEFLDCIKGLAIEDYAYIQKLSLQEDGHPLGDYILRLYSSYFGRLLLDDPDVCKHQKILDALKFEILPPSHGFPSQKMKKICNAAQFDKTDKDLRYNRGPNGNSDKDNGLPLLNIGDIFYKDKKSDVYIIMNAQCDLAFTPDYEKRKFDQDKSILILPGKLQNFDDYLGNESEGKPRTDFFITDDGSCFRIIWAIKKWLTKPYGEIEKWLSDEGYERVSRLKLPYALQIQQLFASDLTRVGLPVSPPISQPARIQLCTVSKDGKVDSLIDTKKNVMLFIKGNGQRQCVLLDNLILEIKNKIDTSIGNWEHQKSKAEQKFEKANGDSSKQEKADKKINKCKDAIEKLNNFKNSYDAFLLREPFLIPAKDGKEEKISNLPIGIVKNANTSASASYGFVQPLILNVIIP